jgi:hypothetical protein
VLVVVVVVEHNSVELVRATEVNVFVVVIVDAEVTVSVSIGAVIVAVLGTTDVLVEVTACKGVGQAGECNGGGQSQGEERFCEHTVGVGRERQATMVIILEKSKVQNSSRHRYKHCTQASLARAEAHLGTSRKHCGSAVASAVSLAERAI